MQRNEVRRRTALRLRGEEPRSEETTQEQRRRSHAGHSTHPHQDCIEQ